MTWDAAQWQSSGFIAFDTETTGVDVTSERIVSAAAVKFVGGVEVESREWLLKVDIPIPAQAAGVHGITDDISQSQGIDQSVAIAEIVRYLQSSGLPVVCFNSAFDRSILHSNAMRLGVAPLESVPDICPYVIDRQYDKYVKGKAQRRLQPTVARYGLTLSEADWHGALADSRITGLLFLAQMKRFPEVFTNTPQHLSDLVSQWRSQQDADFKRWLAGQPPLSANP